MPLHPLPDDRYYSNLIPIVGKKFGHLTVLSMAGRRAYTSPAGRTQRYALVNVRCDCGLVYVAEARAVRRAMNRCKKCSAEHTASVSRSRSHRLPSGRTWVEVAEASGVSLNTVTQRWLRGWPEEDLGLPVRGKRPREDIRFREAR